MRSSDPLFTVRRACFGVLLCHRRVDRTRAAVCAALLAQREEAVPRRQRRENARVDQLDRARTLARVVDEAARDELAERFAAHPGRAQRGELAAVVASTERVERLHVGVWRSPFDDLDGGDAERPDVGLAVVSAVVQDFRRHVQGRAGVIPSLLPPFRERACDAKVGELDLAARRREDVARLDVEVDDGDAVEVNQPLERLAADVPNLLLGERAERRKEPAEYVLDRPRLAVVHHNPQLLLGDVRPVVRDDV